MKIAVLRETRPDETRVALTPVVTGQLIKQGHTVKIEPGAGDKASSSDNAYESAGAAIASGADLYDADLYLKVQPPTAEQISQMKAGSTLVSFLYPTLHQDLADLLARQKVNVFAMNAIPRISRAQNMDALSSQGNLAGYKSVILGANAMGKIFPLMMTAAGTITPSRVLIYGAGVAGLQAIATAKRLGAIVEVSDVRPETKEQVESLGGKFIEVKSDEQVTVEGGYAKTVSEDYLKLQQEAVLKSLVQADLVITTALVMGRQAPVLVTEDMVKQMKPGAVIVDMAVEQGGNCAASEAGQTVVKHGVTIIGQTNLPALLPQNASELYARNILNLLNHLATPEGLKWEMDEEITKGTLLIHEGNLRF